MRERISFISVLTMFLAIGFVIIFSRPVKAAADGVILKANPTCTTYADICIIPHRVAYSFFSSSDE